MHVEVSLSSGRLSLRCTKRGGCYLSLSNSLVQIIHTNAIMAQDLARCLSFTPSRIIDVSATSAHGDTDRRVIFQSGDHPFQMELWQIFVTVL